MRQKQEENSRTIHLIRKHLLQHVKDMHVWKVFLDQEKEYEAENLHIVMEPELEAIAFEVQMNTLDKAITEENTKLGILHQERIEAEKEIKLHQQQLKEQQQLQQQKEQQQHLKEQQQKELHQQVPVTIKKEEPKAVAPSSAKEKEKKKKKDKK